MQFKRHFTKSSASPYEGVPFRLYRPMDSAGPVARFDAPAAWSDDAIAAYYGVASRRCDIPARTRQARESDVPRWLWRRVPDRGALAEMPAAERTGGERSARDVIDRMAGALAYWGWHAGYFDGDDDAAAFVDELRYLLCHRYVLGAPERIRNAGVHWAYGLFGGTERHYVADFRSGRIVRSDECHEPHIGPQIGNLALAQGGQESVVDLCSGRSDTRGWLRQANGIRFARSTAQWHTCPRSGRAGWSPGESGFLFATDSACPLLAIDLARFADTSSKLDVTSLERAARTVTMALDISLAATAYRNRETAAVVWDHRPLGLALTNFSGLCAAMGTEFGSGPARALSAAAAALVTGTAYGVSAELASVMGAFPEFEVNRRPMLRAIHNHRQAALGRTIGYQGLTRPPIPLDGAVCPDQELVDRARQNWDWAMAAGERYGFRNAQTTLAPDPEIFGEPAAETGNSSVDTQIRMMAAVQPFLSGAVGAPVTLPPQMGFDTASSVYQLAWRLGLKGLTVAVPGTRLSAENHGLRLLGSDTARRAGSAAGEHFDN